jgi:hypothetical protein
MRLCTRVSRGEFAFFARPRATSRAMNSLNLFESWLLGLHGWSIRPFAEENMVNSDQWDRIIWGKVRIERR